MSSKVLVGLIISGVVSATAAFAQPGKVTVASSTAPAATSSRAITVITEPKAVVWIDDIRRGVTDESGKLVIRTVPSGLRKMRVRADGFKETSVSLLPAQRGDVKVALAKTTDEAELAFQEAEAFVSRDREKAIAAYQRAVGLRPKFAEAYVGLARVLTANADYDGAHNAVAAARRARPGYAEASAVEGRIYNAESEEEKAAASFKRAIVEGKGFQPEAHTGLGLLYKEKAEGMEPTAEGQAEKANYYDLAAGELRKAITQLSGAPDAKDIYQLLGDVYYRARRYREAIKVYEEFIRVFPDSNEVTTMRSLILQTTKEMNGEQ